MSIKRFALFLCILWISVGVIACDRTPRTPTSSTPPPTSPPPTLATPSPVTLSTAPPDGATLLQERCTACHSLDRVQGARKSRDEWEQTVDRMIRRGARLNAAERDALIAYLAAEYGP